MTKRLHDTSIHERGWYRMLPPEYKCFWLFINDDCDMSGIWLIDLDVAQFSIHGLNKQNLVCLEKAKEFFKHHILEIDGGKRWFIISFIKIQYASRLGNNAFHQKILKTLLSYNIDLNKYGISYNSKVNTDKKYKYPNKDLSDPRWKKKKSVILQRDNYKCQMCEKEEMLDVHHKFYIEGRRLWEYEDADLITLCKSCHSEEHSIIRKRKNFRESIAI